MNSVPGQVDPDWRRLWQLAERLRPGADEVDDYSLGTAADVFGYVGLFLVNPDEPVGDGGYATSPLGAAAFGGTHGDGVYFSLLPPDASGASPVVMTSPMSDNPNIIVGGDLREFLALGCTAGYWVLEQLAYDVDGEPGWGRNATIRRVQCAEPDGTDEEVALLRALTTEFDLSPWPDAAGRLAELERIHSDRIRLDPRRV